MLRLIKFFLLGLVLLLVCFFSALLAMRFAIHGREVRVPQLRGMTPAEAERLITADGLVLSIDSRFYSTEFPEGRIVSQLPAPGTRVRRGWKIRVAQSLGSQRAAVPSVVGQSERVAELNIARHGLEVGSVATIHFAGAAPSTVIAQNPAGETRNAASPKISLLVAAPDNVQKYAMPNFVGQPLAAATASLQRSGFTLGEVQKVSGTGAPGSIVRQYPAAGQKIAAGTTINFDVHK